MIGATLSGTATPDGVNAGRYTLPLSIVTDVCEEADLNAVIYQASGGQLFWMDEDEESLSLGSFQQQASLAGLRAVKKTMAKPKRKTC